MTSTVGEKRTRRGSWLVAGLLSSALLLLVLVLGLLFSFGAWLFSNESADLTIASAP